MHDVDISRVDLNLLVALDVLLREGNVTRAARRLGRTQPAMSHALGRLRETFEDPLLVRSGRGMIPTPRAEALREPLRRALAELARLLHEGGDFDPAGSTRAFRLVCPDLLAWFLPDLLAAMSRVAPGVTLDVRPPGADLGGSLASADLALGASESPGAGLVRVGLGEVTQVILARRDHPGLSSRGRLTKAKWLAYPHIQVGGADASQGFVERALEVAGLRRTVGLRVPGFLVAPEVVARTDFFFAAPRELVEPLASRLDLRMLKPPIPMPPVPVSAFWHERVRADAGHRWFRDIVVGQVRALLGGPRPALDRRSE